MPEYPTDDGPVSGDPAQQPTDDASVSGDPAKSSNRVPHPSSRLGENLPANCTTAPTSAHTNLPEEPPAIGACTSVGLPQRTNPAFPLTSAEPQNLFAARCPSLVSKWSWRRDLNPRPSDYKSDALPAELRQPDHYETLPGNTGKSADTLRLRA